jgi:tRNA (cytidine/uridine-2'-O-)-methyltransferase
MSLNIVLIEPEIPTNTGNIGRLSLASGSKLHLVKPFGFEITDARLKRAGLDYWPHVDLVIYESLEDFMTQHSDKKMAFLSSHATTNYTQIPYENDLFLVFGRESVGLPKPLIAKFADHLYKIPIQGPHIRSLNLANAVSIIVYEGLRQLDQNP